MQITPLAVEYNFFGIKTVVVSVSTGMHVSQVQAYEVAVEVWLFLPCKKKNEQTARKTYRGGGYMAKIRLY
jgi:hypothetical protein